MKRKMPLLCFMVLCFCSFSNVNAGTITEEIFNQALENEQVIEGELLEYAIENGHILRSEERYSETVTIYNSYTNEIIDMFEREITAEEYENYNPIQPLGSCGPYCYETNAKKFTFNIFSTQYISVYTLQLYNVWKTVPKVKSYDIIAARWEIGNGLGITADNTKIHGEQRYCINSDCSNTVFYDKSSSNTKVESNGAGVSMNIVDNATSGIENLLKITLYTYGSGTLKLYGTYQHATSDISLATAKSYSFGNGLGNVLVYPSATASKFDNMSGININANIPL